MDADAARRCTESHRRQARIVREEPLPAPETRSGTTSTSRGADRDGEHGPGHPHGPHYGEEHLGVTDIFGEDVGPPLGGVFTATQGLKTAWNTPLDERGIIGTAMGIAYAGGRPVAEIQFCDYAFNTIDLLKIAGNSCWASDGDWTVPIVVMTPVGAGIRGSIYHSHSFDATLARAVWPAGRS